MKTVVRTIRFLLVVLLYNCTGHSPYRQANSVSFEADSICYRVEFYSPRLVRILSLPIGDTLITQRLVVDKNLPVFTDYRLQATDQEYLFSTAELSIRFDRQEQAFSFREASTHKLLLQEKSGRQARTFIPSEAGGEKCLRVVQRFVPTTDEALYGLGQYQTGTFNYRNDTALLLQANMDVVNPFLLSTHQYGLLWDNYSATRFKDNAQGYSFDSEVADASDYYFVYGKSMDEVVAGYRTLTGRVPMFAKGTLGFWQSKERYRSFAELEAVVKEYRRRNIPLDNIVQDWEYWGDKAHWNGLVFDSLHFAHPRQFIDRLHQQYQVRLMLSVWPGFGPATSVYRALDSIGALFDEPTWAGYKIFDVYHPQAREIFWHHLKKGLYDQGVDAWWLDATEPSFREGFTQLKQEEKTKSAGRTYLGCFNRYLNVYSLELTKYLYGKLREAGDDKRVFILTRSAFASQQKYATAIWSGDVSASWENFRKQIPAGLNLSMSGIPYWTSDIGGFFVSEREAAFPRGLNDEAYKELYCRWFQFGAFCPLFRAHGTNVPREIWQFGSPGTPYYDTQLQYIHLRYRLLPYLYALARQTVTDHYTLMRGLAMDFPSDTVVYNIDSAYMLGPALLVRPVLQPATAGVPLYTSTYLPQHVGQCWYDFHTGEYLKAGSQHSKHTPLEIMPLYVKGGSILPMAPVRQYATEYPDRQLEIRIYSGTDVAFRLYDDEGEGYNFEKGFYSEIDLRWNETSRTFTIGKRQGNFPGMPTTLELTVKLYSPHHIEPIVKSFSYHGEQVKLQFQ